MIPLKGNDTEYLDDVNKVICGIERLSDHYENTDTVTSEWLYKELTTFKEKLKSEVTETLNAIHEELTKETFFTEKEKAKVWNLLYTEYGIDKNLKGRDVREELCEVPYKNLAEGWYVIEIPYEVYVNLSDGCFDDYRYDTEYDYCLRYIKTDEDAQKDHRRNACSDYVYINNVYKIPCIDYKIRRKDELLSMKDLKRPYKSTERALVEDYFTSFLTTEDCKDAKEKVVEEGSTEQVRLYQCEFERLTEETFKEGWYYTEKQVLKDEKNPKTKKVTTKISRHYNLKYLSKYDPTVLRVVKLPFIEYV